MELRYPAPPPHVSADLSKPSASFRREVWKVLAAILLFILVYLLMIAGAVALTVVCFRIGIALIVLHPSIWTLLLGAGIMLVGILVLFFLVKFVFAKSEEGVPKGVEIKESDEPELFEFIRKIAAEVNTHFPRKIILTTQVNAAVFYSSGFWSLLFPVRKNLAIGLGLVNTVNVSEFKSIMAHEFGHFSQNSMRLGSYVYYVNRAIHNMLYQNSGWGNAAQGLINAHTILAIFTYLAVFIVRGIQWVLEVLFSLINKLHRSLSREMEFHADTISAIAAGSNNAVSALHRVKYGQALFDRTLEFTTEQLNQQNAALRNFYASQRFITTFYSKRGGLKVQHDLPVITPEFIARQRRERVVFTDQWASHPTDVEREQNLRSLGLQGETLDVPAWTLFRQAEKWQQELTAYMYSDVPKEAIKSYIEEKDFPGFFLPEEEKVLLPAVFNSFFDDRFIVEADPAALFETPAAAFDPERFHAVFNDGLVGAIQGLNQDIAVLKGIQYGSIETRTFDFDGQKYRREAAGELLMPLEAELEEKKSRLDQRDKEAWKMLHSLARSKGADTLRQWETHYQDFYALNRIRRPANGVLFQTYLGVQELRNNGYTLEGPLRDQFNNIRLELEPKAREVLAAILDAKILSENVLKEIDVFLKDTPSNYERMGVVIQPNLEALQKVVLYAGQELDERYFNALKSLLELSATLIPDVE